MTDLLPSLYIYINNKIAKIANLIYKNSKNKYKKPKNKTIVIIIVVVIIIIVIIIIYIVFNGI